MGTPGTERVRVLAGSRGERPDQRVGDREDDLGDTPELQREPSVEHVARGEPVVDPAPRRPGRGREHVDECGGVVIGDLLPLGDRLDREGGRADRLELLLGRAVHLLAGGHLDLAHRLEVSVLRPDLGHLGPRVTGDHWWSSS